jgi:hypothetical protein
MTVRLISVIRKVNPIDHGVFWQELICTGHSDIVLTNWVVTDYYQVDSEETPLLLGSPVESVGTRMGKEPDTLHKRQTTLRKLTQDELISLSTRHSS